jgi:hypothetical protein
MATGLEWTRLSEDRSRALYKIAAMIDRAALSLVSSSFSSLLFRCSFRECINILLVSVSSRARYRTTIWGLVKYCRMHGGRFEDRTGNVRNANEGDKSWIKGTRIKRLAELANYRVSGDKQITTRWLFDDSGRPRRDLDQSVHNMSRAGDICTNVCIY